MKLFRIRQKRTLTVFGRFLCALLLIVLAAALAAALYPFLAQNAPRAGAALAIIEGWLPDAELIDTVVALPSGTLLVTTGGPIQFAADFFDQKTYAELTAARLRRFGIDSRRILAAPAPETAADRTYTAALAVRRVLEQHELLGRPANLYSLGPHSRRSFLLYRFALGPDAPLGVVSVESQTFDLRRWWRSSHAFKAMLTELTAWFYTQCTRWKYD